MLCVRENLALSGRKGDGRVLWWGHARSKEERKEAVTGPLTGVRIGCGGLLPNVLLHRQRYAVLYKQPPITR